MKKITINTLMFCGFAGTAFSQNVGISEAAPNSKLDVVQTETTGNSIEVTHGITTSTSDAVFIKNNSLGRGINVWNQLTTNANPVGLFEQNGTGDGIISVMPVGNSSTSIISLHQGTNALGIYNEVTNGIGQYNFINSNNISTYHDLTTAGGFGDVVDLGVQDGAGMMVIAVDNPTTPTAGGDVIGLSAFVRTATPTVGVNVSGAALAGEQYGVGHGILVSHYGNSGRNAEFNIINATNTSPALFTSHTGRGSAIVAQNQSNAITGTISVADISYTGTDADDHIAVEGTSTPSAGYGIGVLGTGNWYGIASIGDMTATGVKPFTIDHPSDPENKMLKHFSIESNEVLNLYRGTIELDANGKAVVELPDYFELINKDFSYQLTAIGTPVHPYVFSEIEGNSFIVAGEPNTKVSWTVYADRNDAYIQQHPEKAIDVVEKEGNRQGKYFSPELYNQPESKGMFYHENNLNNQQSKIDFSKTGLSQDKKEEIRNKRREIEVNKEENN